MGKKMIPLLLAACLMLTACAAAADLCHGRTDCSYISEQKRQRKEKQRQCNI